MIGIGPGIEQNAHTIGECVNLREMVAAVVLMARFPSAFVAAASSRDELLRRGRRRFRLATSRASLPPAGKRRVPVPVR
jgi:hypothetical protein